MNALNYIQKQPKHYLAQNKANVMNKADEILGEFLSDQSSIGQDNLIAGIERETQFVINQLTNLKKIHQQAKNRLLQQECQISSDLDRLHPLGEGSSSPLDPHRTQLKIRLSQLDDKRQRLDFDFFDRQNKCLEKLVALTSKHKLLDSKQNP